MSVVVVVAVHDVFVDPVFIFPELTIDPVFVLPVFVDVPQLLS